MARSAPLIGAGAALLCAAVAARAAFAVAMQTAPAAPGPGAFDAVVSERNPTVDSPAGELVFGFVASPGALEIRGFPAVLLETSTGDRIADLRTVGDPAQLALFDVRGGTVIGLAQGDRVVVDLDGSGAVSVVWKGEREALLRVAWDEQRARMRVAKAWSAFAAVLCGVASGLAVLGLRFR